jgi:hypothetical protein
MVSFACSKEEKLEPTEMRYDYFTISPDATDEESILRRTFYETNKIHLLFNDTLRHEQRGTYADGTPYWFTELLDLSYNITGTTDGARFTYIQDIRHKEEAVHFVETYILPHLGEGLRPYSIFLVEKMESYSYGWSETNFYNGRRCLALSTQGISDMDEEEIKEQCIDIFYSIIAGKTKYYDEELTEFIAFGAPYYGEYFSSFQSLTKPKPTAEEMYTLGFISWSSWSSYFPYESSDLTAFLKAVFYEDEDTFKTQYAEYPVILQKYDIMKEVVKKKGYIF